MKKTLLFLSLIFIFSFSTHKYYLALTEIEYNKKSKSVQMIMNVFIDDIELALNKDYQINAQLNTKNEIDNIDSYFYKYLQKHFDISINNEINNYTFVGKEYDGDIVYFYLEIENINSVSSITVKNNVLTNYFTDQQNLIKASVNKISKSLFLNKTNNKGLLKF